MDITQRFPLNILLFLTFVPFICPTSTITDILTGALLSLKSDFTDPRNTLQDWSIKSETDPSQLQPTIQSCSWSGITCNANETTLVSINLSGRNLGGSLSGKKLSFFRDLQHFNLSYNSFSGPLPAEIFNLTELRTLDISRNNFSGEFPGKVSFLGMKSLVLIDAFSNSFSGHLPGNLPQAKALEVLNLAGSYFSGGIPPQYGRFESIRFIHLAGNFLSGRIPPELGSLRTLTHMEIGYNSYEGGIPLEFGNLSEITYLDIANANLSGPIPKELSNLTKLESLFLFQNHLVGLLPWELSRIESLADLDLSDNLISGPIPESFSGLKNLRLLSLFYNSMNGTVPHSISQLPSLETLFIWNNFFGGSLPGDLGMNLNLKWVDVSTNKLVGPIPPRICSGGALTKLIMFSNRFSGTLLPLASGCASLVRLRLEDNSFSGGIPFNFSRLSYIDLSMNNITGPIPPEISGASNLQYFNVSRNPGIRGTIPAGIWSMPSLKNLSMSGCNIGGELPAFGSSCGSVSVIELGENALTGSIPEGISSCHELRRIDFSGNDLTGQIPQGIASLPSLTALDLSRNILTGLIPSRFGDSLSLRQFNVSFNDMYGSIPSGKAFISMDRSSYIGNRRLCGPPLRPCPNSVAILGSRSGAKGKLMLVLLLLCLGLVILTTLFVLGLFYFIKGRKRGSWKMISFDGLPQFTPNDILRSFEVSSTGGPVVSSKAVLPTGITVSVKKIEWALRKRMVILLGLINRMGDARHPNLARLLGFCHNREVAYLLYDYLPNGNLVERIGTNKHDWRDKLRVVSGIARGLCYLHHECIPPIPHGDLKSSNVVFDDNMEPRLTGFGLKHLAWLSLDSSAVAISDRDSEEFSSAIKDQIEMDIFNFGEIIVDILTNGRLAGAGESIQSKSKDVLLREICSSGNRFVPDGSVKEEVKLVLEIALLCTQRQAADRPTARDALKLLMEHKKPGE
ncbi:hypothetical protein SAY87_007422 [Trapa incisa]|uniref:Protein kinase domain-containing protein n=1 Tax=Trapa incisa TaxID=236973 RepID=A0AAN7Q5S2_9MYRT|nr:hypothetical protein SAY87_007422 [Trapa incisa]